MSSLSMEDLNCVLRWKLKDEPFEIVLSGNKNISKVTEGILSQSGSLSVKYKRENKIEELYLFVKRLPQSPHQQTLITTLGIFEKEVLLYNLFLRDFEKFIPDISYPKCYLARSNDLIVLEDLTHCGFKSLNKIEIYDLEHCEKSIEAISKFHAASVIYEQRTKSKLCDVMPSIQHPGTLNIKIDVDKHFFLTGIKALRKITSIYLKNHSKETIEKAFKYFDIMPHKLGPSNKFLNVLTHGDIWGANIMFSYDSNNKLHKACLIDFQLSSYTTAAFDLLMLLYNCTTYEFRKQYFKYLTKYYYSKLHQHVSLANIDLETIMSWSDFEMAINEAIPVMLAMSTILIHFALMPENVIRGVLNDDRKFKCYREEDRDRYVLSAFETSNLYKERVLDSLTAFINHFYS